jgi:hypothetical protein
MKIIQEKENYLKTHIRDILAINPLVTIRSMQTMMEKRTGHSIGDKYLSKLMQKIRREAIIRSDVKRIDERLTEVRERNRVHIEHLERVVYWSPEYRRQYGIHEPQLREKLAAIKLVSYLDIALLKAELMLGLFENKKVTSVELSKSQTTTLKVGFENK